MRHATQHHVPTRLTRVLALAAVHLFAVGAFAAPSVFVTDATRKILPGDTPPSSATSYHLYAARNEFEAAQIIVVGQADNVSASSSGLTGPGGTIPVRFFREGLITLQNPSSTDGWTGPTPDPMIPDVDDVVGEQRNAFPFAVPAGQSRVIWAEVLVPPAAAAGDYTGTVTIQSTQGSASVTLTLTVWGFELPAASSLRSHFGLSYGGLPAGHGVSVGSAFSQLRARYSQMGLDHRISLGYFDDGVNTTANFETYYAPLVAGTAPTQLSGARLTTVQFIGSGYSTWMDFFAQKGWPPIIFQYTCDEPPQTCAWSDIPTRAAQARAVGMPTLVTTDIDSAVSHDVDQWIDLIVPVINFMDGQADRYAAWTAPGDIKELWTYQSCMSHGCGGNADGWASYMIDAAAVRARAQEWLSFQWGGTGELYWDTTYAYSHDAWTNQWDFTGNGDGTLFYPGTPAKIGGSTHIPVASLRLKMIREGYEDYEYLKLVADLGDPTFARDTAAALFPAANQVQPSVADLMAARQALATRILELSGQANQPCSDGTAAGACSATKPMRCVAGTLTPACGTCGCPSGQLCETGGSCSSPPAYTAGLLETPPAIDGQLDEYAALPAITLAGASGSAEVRAGWDPEALYLAFDVTDDTLVPSSGGEGEIYDGDAVEVMLDTALDRAGSAALDDYHFLVSSAGTLADSQGWDDYGFSSGAEVSAASRVGGYRVELKIPWSAVGFAAAAEMQLGFDVAFDDKDAAGGAVSPKDFAGLTSFNNPAGWGVLVLGSGETPPSDGGVVLDDGGNPVPVDGGGLTGDGGSGGNEVDASACGCGAGGGGRGAVGLIVIVLLVALVRWSRGSVALSVARDEGHQQRGRVRRRRWPRPRCRP